VNYADVHGRNVPLNDDMLNSSYHTGHAAREAPQTTAWWHQFHDTQLNQYVTQALTDSPTLQVAKSRIDSARHMADESQANLWPTLDAYGDVTRERISQNTIYPPGYGGNSYTESYFGLTFQYEFDFWGKNRQALAARISEAKAAAADYAEARLVLTAAVISQYFELQYNQAALKLGEALYHQRQEIYNIVNVRASRGVASDIPLSQVKNDKDLAQVNVTVLAERVKISQHKLAALIGKNPFTARITVQPFHYNKHLLTLPPVLRANLLGHRPDVMAARWRIEVAAHNVNAAKARFYPNINLIGILSLQSYIPSLAFNSASRDNSIGAAIDLPLFDAGKRRANLATQFDEYDIAREQYNQAILNGLREVADEAATLHSLSAQVTQQQQALAATEQVYHLTNSRYAHGITEYLNVLQQKVALLQVQNQQLQTQSYHQRVAVQLYKALGGQYPQEGSA
jgi:NodT family efflux transporter outer membrane factor (OMF) lipoprotein